MRRVVAAAEDYMENKFVTGLKKFLFYAAGLVLIAVGINFSRLSQLGISPVSSVPGSCNAIWGWSLGTMTIIVYCVLILLQILVLRKKFKPLNLLGIPIAVAFGVLVDLVGVVKNTQFFGIDTSGFGHWLAWLPAPGNYLMRVFYFVLSLLLIAIGVFLYLRPKWPAMPAEGLAAAIAQQTGMKFGNCKTIVDTSMILIAFLMHFYYILLVTNTFVIDYFKAFVGIESPVSVVVGIGTLISAVVIGQLVKLLTKLLGKPLDNFLFKKKKEEPKA